MDTGMPLFFLEIQYLLLETIPLETIMRVIILNQNNLTIWKKFQYFENTMDILLKYTKV